MDSVNLLDTPKRLTLSTRSADLRASLKDWEKSYAASHGGQKPGKDDIKADQDISKKYKEYNRLRDVLAGKLAFDALHEQKSPTRPAKRLRADPAISLTPRKSHRARRRHPNDLDPYDHPASASPKPVFLDAIGPTPQRDGRVLGLFDLLSRSGRSLQATPSARRRKFDASYGEGMNGAQKMVAQTPSQRVEENAEDLLQYFSGDIVDSANRRKHSRTPASEGKKFMLSHFFATPTALRYTALGEESKGDDEAVDRTPLRSLVLGRSRVKPIAEDIAAIDATPTYLKRSFSFKDRLLSASNIPATRTGGDYDADFTSPTAVRRRLRPLQCSRSMPKPLSQIVQDLRKLEDEQHDDDMDALREIEGNSGSGAQINTSHGSPRPANADVSRDENNPEATGITEPRIWKKKGQKRTTRRSVMRPAIVKPKDAPKWVAPEDEDEDEKDELPQIEETQLVDSDRASSTYGDLLEDELALVHDSHNRKRGREQENVEDENEVGSPKRQRDRKSKSGSGKKSKTHQKSEESKEKERSKEEKGRTINPNAHSHTNFRSLKIRNKNSKAKSGGRFGGRFGKGRR